MLVALHEVFGLCGHVVAQVVEAELVVRAESDVRGVCSAAFLRVGFSLVDAVNGQSVELVERAHPFRVALCEVVVDSHNVHTLASERVEEHGERCDECLALTSSHFGNVV